MLRSNDRGVVRPANVALSRGKIKHDQNRLTLKGSEACGTGTPFLIADELHEANRLWVLLGRARISPREQDSSDFHIRLCAHTFQTNRLSTHLKPSPHFEGLVAGLIGIWNSKAARLEGGQAENRSY
jgi:hypothetical protein